MKKSFKKQDILRLSEMTTDTFAHKLNISYETADYLIDIITDDKQIKKVFAERE